MSSIKPFVEEKTAIPLQWNCAILVTGSLMWIDTRYVANPLLWNFAVATPEMILCHCACWPLLHSLVKSQPFGKDVFFGWLISFHCCDANADSLIYFLLLFLSIPSPKEYILILKKYEWKKLGCKIGFIIFIIFTTFSC